MLVIEDDPDVALAIRAVLEGGGLEVLTEGDGRAGLHAFHACRPGLVVLDVGLPVLDGWDVLSRIRELSEVPVLMLTSHGLEDEKVRGLRRAPTTTSPSRSATPSCWPGSRRCCAAGLARPGRGGPGRDLPGQPAFAGPVRW